MNIYDELLKIRRILEALLGREVERDRQLAEINQRLEKMEKIERAVKGLKDALIANSKDLIERLEKIDI